MEILIGEQILGVHSILDHSEHPSSWTMVSIPHSGLQGAFPNHGPWEASLGPL